MPSRKTVAGKHPIIVRLTEQEYKAVKKAAFDHDVTPNVWIGLCAVNNSMEYIDSIRKE